MGLTNEAIDGLRRFGVGHFDLLAVEEAHRSIDQKYWALFRPEQVEDLIAILARIRSTAIVTAV